MAIKKTLDIQRETMEEPGELVSERKFRFPVDWRSVNITLVLFVIAVWSAYFITKMLSGQPDQKSDSFVKSSEEQTKTEEAASTDTPKADETKSETTTETTTKDQADTFVKETDQAAVAPPKDSFSTRILNGNGVNGDAAKIKTQLTTAGFKVGTVGNAKLKYEQTEIYFIAGKDKEADLIKSALADKETVLKPGQDNLVGSGYEVLVVIGTK